MWWPEHFGLVTANLDRSVEFYSALLDREPLERVLWKGEAARYVADLLATPGLTLRAAFFHLPHSNTVLEVIEYSNIESGSPIAAPPTAVGAVHFGFYVDSIEDAAQRIQAAGGGFLAPPVAIPYGPYSGGRTAYFRDPDGVNLQVMEVSSRPGRLPVLKGSKSVAGYDTE
ncbi:MAG: hypothetical protein EHM57_07415 [Actinobacteria bacterium]|nr:MAG: hypothetical protein EHM57_07415 [Actinomycetota bacterium]